VRTMRVVYCRVVVLVLVLVLDEKSLLTSLVYWVNVSESCGADSFVVVV